MLDHLTGDPVFALFDSAKRKASKLQSIRYIACDLDGTLLNSSNLISGKTADTIKDLQDAGIEPILVSGRSDGFIRKFAETLGLRTPVISLNGLLMMDGSQNALHVSTLPHGIGGIIHDMAGNDARTSFSAFTPSGIHSQTLPSQLPRYLKACVDEQHYAEQIEAHFDSTVMFVVQGPYGHVQSISVRIAKEYKDTIERLFYQSQQNNELYYLEVKKRGVHKGTALRAFSRHFKVPAKSIGAIGDYANDIEMCRYAGVSAAVRNAIGDLKDTVDYVLRATNDEDGAAEFFQLVLSAQPGIRS